MATSLGIENAAVTGGRAIATDSLLGTRKQFTDTYLVRMDSLNENEDDAINAAGIPTYLSIASGAVLINKEAEEVDAQALLWRVFCRYDSQVDQGPGSGGQGVGEVNGQPARIWVTEEEIEEVIDSDQQTGLPIVNSVGEPIIITAPYSILVLNIQRLENRYTPSDFFPYTNHVNSAPFYGAPPGTALLKGPTAERVVKGTQTLFSVLYRIKFNLKIDPTTLQPRGWVANILNQGENFRVVVPGGTFLIPFRADGDNTTGNLNLDGSYRDRSLPAIYLQFNRFPQADLNDLNLGP